MNTQDELTQIKLAYMSTKIDLHGLLHKISLIVSPDALGGLMSDKDKLDCISNLVHSGIKEADKLNKVIHKLIQIDSGE